MKQPRRRRRSRLRVAAALALVVLGGAASLAVWEIAWLRIAELGDSKTTRVLVVPAAPGRTRELALGPKSPFWTPLAAISPAVVRAVVASEDARFFQHAGFDWEELRNAVEADLEAGRYRRGGSTITMQLARNLFLWRRKSIVRKALEIYLTWRLERELPKRRILELYLNLVEWGPGIYGIGEASRHYFDRPPSDLTLSEAALLAAILPDPVKWGPDRAPEVARRRQRELLERLAREDAP